MVTPRKELQQDRKARMVVRRWTRAYTRTAGGMLSSITRGWPDSVVLDHQTAPRSRYR